MLKMLKGFWGLISFGMLVLTFFQLPTDLLSVPADAKPWQKLLGIIDQLTAFKAFAVMAFAYIAWIDFRPLLYQWHDERWPKEPTKPKLVLTQNVDYGGPNGACDILCAVGNAGTPCDVIAYVMAISGVFSRSTTMMPAAWRHLTDRRVRLFKNHSEACLLARADPESGMIYLVSAGQDGKAIFSPAARIVPGRPLSFIIQIDLVSEPESVEGPVRLFVVTVCKITGRGGSSMSVSMARSLAEAELAAKGSETAMSMGFLGFPEPSNTATKTQL